VSDPSAWLGSRRPEPPGELADRLGTAPGTSPDELAEAAVEKLSWVLTRPGRVRESAFLLLEADALLTYACEAALESDDPEAALRRILSAAGG